MLRLLTGAVEEENGRGKEAVLILTKAVRSTDIIATTISI